MARGKGTQCGGRCQADGCGSIGVHFLPDPNVVLDYNTISVTYKHFQYPANLRIVQTSVSKAARWYHRLLTK
jgi:hypothetical protein